MTYKNLLYNVITFDAHTTGHCALKEMAEIHSANGSYGELAGFYEFEKFINPTEPATE